MTDRIIARLRRPSTIAFLVFAAVYWIAALSIFSGALPLDKSMVQPDHNMVYSPTKAWDFLQSVVAGGPFVPFDLHWFIGSPYWWAELEYAIPCFLAGLALAFYLRMRRLSGIASYGAAIAYSLMGYLFTLFSAGHLGWFEYISYGIFSFGLIDLAVRKGKVRNWMLLGAVLAWSSVHQPDLWMLHTALAFCYGLWCIFREGVARRPAAGRFCRNLLLGGVICAAVALAVGAPQFSHAVFSDLAGRDEQVKATTGETAEDRWEFATNWSMAPSDMVEFVASGVHGDSSDTRVSPKSMYWGELGRPIESKFQPGKMMPNYRQHSLYLGAISVAFALLGLVCFVWPRRRDEFESYDDLPFWTVALALCVLLSLGRYTPFYRLVYSLPLMDYLRAPVKFHHLTELCVAVLAGFGIEGLIRGKFACRARLVPALILVGLVAFLCVTLCLAYTDAQPLVNSVAALGYGPELAQTLVAAAGPACLRGAGLLLLVLVLVSVWRFLPRKAAIAALVVVLAVNAIDLAMTDAKYVCVQDISFARAENHLAADVKKEKGGRFLNLIGQQFNDSFLAGGMTDGATRFDDPEIRFVVAPAAELAKSDSQLSKYFAAKNAKTIGYYQVTAQGFRRVMPTGAQVALVMMPHVVKSTEEKSDKGGFGGAVSLVSVLATFTVLLIAAGLPLLTRRH